MQVNGKQVDALQWLRETGGASAVKRFSKTQSTSQTASSGKPTLSKDEVALLKSQAQFNKGAVAPGMTANKVSEFLSQLNDLKPAAQSLKTSDKNGVDFDSSKTSTATVNGKNNNVDFRSPAGGVDNNSVTMTGSGNTVRGYNGGQKNNTVALTGDANRVYAGQGVSGANVTVKGSANNVDLGENASGNNVSINGKNVKVSIGSQGLAAGSNQQWNISVAADNVEISVVNGKASVKTSEAMKDSYKIDIDDTKKTVSVTAI